MRFFSLCSLRSLCSSRSSITKKLSAASAHSLRPLRWNQLACSAGLFHHRDTEDTERQAWFGIYAGIWKISNIHGVYIFFASFAFFAFNKEKGLSAASAFSLRPLRSHFFCPPGMFACAQSVPASPLCTLCLCGETAFGSSPWAGHRAGCRGRLRAVLRRSWGYLRRTRGDHGCICSVRDGRRPLGGGQSGAKV